MFSLWSTTLLYGFCLLENPVRASNTTTVTKPRNEPLAVSPTTPSPVGTGDTLCSSHVSKVPGSALESSEEAEVTCQCSTSSCPTINFLNGEEYLFIDTKKFEIGSDSCQLQYIFRLRSNLKVGRQRVTITCKVPDTDDVFGLFDVYTDTASPEISSPRTRLSVYMILAIVAFLLLIIASLGLLFRWQMRSRRRAQRNAHCRSPFIQSQTNYAFTNSTIPNTNVDCPPSYNEATLAYNASGLVFDEKKMEEKTGIQVRASAEGQATAQQGGQPSSKDF